MTGYKDRMRRRVDVYLHAPKDKERWKELAEERGMPLSKWVIAVVEEMLLQNDSARPRETLLKEIVELKDEIAEFRERNRQLETVIDQLEKEVRRYRSLPFLMEDFEGIREFDRDLVRILRESKGTDGKPKPINDQDIMTYLGVSLSESEALKALSRQLAILESYGLVESTTKGWRWKG
ncbi:MAG: hypothetical protein LN416_06160 [Candidatus Thermoplasmatota archaeon]|nr:hypothetical protein [Candidatus Thermoplasmatota archaeon]